jgi:hypothetical protein
VRDGSFRRARRRSRCRLSPRPAIGTINGGNVDDPEVHPEPPTRRAPPRAWPGPRTPRSGEGEVLQTAGRRPGGRRPACTPPSPGTSSLRPRDLLGANARGPSQESAETALQADPTIPIRITTGACPDITSGGFTRTLFPVMNGGTGAMPSYATTQLRI